MAEVVAGLVVSADRRAVARSRRRHSDLWIGISALIAAMLALPQSTSSWHSPEVAAVLAVSATALLAGQRWAIAVIAVAELLLLPTVWPRAFLDGGDLSTRIAPLFALVAIAPGVLALRRAAAALVLLAGRRRTSAACRRVHALLVVGGLLGALVPLLP
jgi:hypothetical protein